MASEYTAHENRRMAQGVSEVEILNDQVSDLEATVSAQAAENARLVAGLREIKELLFTYDGGTRADMAHSIAKKLLQKDKPHG